MTSEYDYDQKIKEQIAQYVDEAIHDLPEIFHHWSHHFIRPGMIDVFGVETVNEFYAEAVSESSGSFERPSKILSIGCGDGDVELELAKSLLDRGVQNFSIEAIDLSPILIDRFRQKVLERRLERYVFPAVRDINEGYEDSQYNSIMANHCLHHFVELEATFDFITRSLNDDGLFVTSDMIGRNGHMRWPEAKAILDIIWPLLTARQRFHHQLLQDHSSHFVNYDCSDVGFEGIRAQDILYLILNRLKPYKFFAFGGFIEVLVDRGYGTGFDANNEEHRALVTSLAQINDVLLDAGAIKPTQMLAYFTKRDMGEFFYRNRSAKLSVRMPYDAPEWVKWSAGSDNA